MTQEEMQDLKSGLYHVNMHLEEHPPGEVRGQLLPESAILFFEGGGPETGITTPGAGGFCFAGGWCLGGTVATLGVSSMSAPGVFHYQMPDGAEVEFFHPVDAQPRLRLYMPHFLPLVSACMYIRTLVGLQ